MRRRRTPSDAERLRSVTDPKIVKTVLAIGFLLVALGMGIFFLLRGLRGAD
jgi:hypothetical protein